MSRPRRRATLVITGMDMVVTDMNTVVANMTTEEEADKGVRTSEALT